MLWHWGFGIIDSLWQHWRYLGHYPIWQYSGIIEITGKVYCIRNAIMISNKRLYSTASSIQQLTAALFHKNNSHVLLHIPPLVTLLRTGPPRHAPFALDGPTHAASRSEFAADINRPLNMICKWSGYGSSLFWRIGTMRIPAVKSGMRNMVQVYASLSRNRLLFVSRAVLAVRIAPRTAPCPYLSIGNCNFLT